MAKEIPLSRGYVTIVDDADYEWLNQWKWAAQVGRDGVYATRSLPSYIDPETGKRVHRKSAMHRELMGVTETWTFVDHADRNGLNNRRSNLRVCTVTQNQCNKVQRNGSTPYKGVLFLDPAKPHNAKYAARPYKALIKVNRHRTHLGYFASMEEAAIERDRAAVVFHGEFAVLNFPERLPEYLANPWTKPAWAS